MNKQTKAAVSLFFNPFLKVGPVTVMLFPFVSHLMYHSV